MLHGGATYRAGILSARFEQVRAVEVLGSIERVLLLFLAFVTDLGQSLVAIADRPPRLITKHKFTTLLV